MKTGQPGEAGKYQDWRFEWGLPLALAAWVFAGFWPSLSNQFTDFDDPDYITANGHVQQGLTWENVNWAFASSHAANWHPLTWLSHMLDYEMFGLEPGGHHFTSLLLHALNVALLFVVLRQMTGLTWPAFFAAAFFGLHPLRVESVAWAAERKDVLSATFWMLTTLAYVKYAKLPWNAGKTAAADTKRMGAYYGIALGLFALGLMAKPMLVTLPCVLLLLDFWPLERLGFADWKINSAQLRRVILEKVPFLLAAAAASWITFRVQKQGGAMATGLALSDRAQNAVIAYCMYLGKLFWPTKLAAFYPIPSHYSSGLVLGAAGLLIGLCILAGWSASRRPYLLTGWFWFVGTLVPVIGLVQVGEQSMADRYSYIPSIGIFIAIVWLAAEFAPGGKWQIGTGIVLALACTGITWKQCSYWKDTETLFRHALDVTENNHLAHAQLGTTFERAGRLDEAAAEYRESLKEKPDFRGAHNNLGIVLDKQGRLEEAITNYQEEIRLNPGYANPHNNLGDTFNKQGRTDEALKEFEEALRLNPNYADAHYNLGIALGRKGLRDDAIREFLLAIKLEPNSADAHNNLGVMLDQKGLLDDAIRHYSAAIRWKPDYARAHFNLGVALARKGNLEAAESEFEVALRLKPDYVEAGKNLEMLRQMKKSRR